MRDRPAYWRWVNATRQRAANGVRPSRFRESIGRNSSHFARAILDRKVRAWNPVRSAHLSRQCSNSPYEGVVAGSSIRRWFLDMIDDEILHRSLFRLERQTKLFTQRVENRRAAA
jgi:hypothetical protein